MTGPACLESLLRRHAGFWRRAPGSGPLVAQTPAKAWRPSPYPLCGGRLAAEPVHLRPDDVDMDRMVGAGPPQGEALDGDLIRPLPYRLPQAWMEALVGCPVFASAHGCTARPAGLGLAEALAACRVETALRSDWASVMDRVLDRAAEVAAGVLPVRQLHLRGVVDMLAAFLGEANLCLAACDQPDLLAALAGRFADLYAAVARRGLARRPVWNGGYVSLWGLYAPGPNLDYQVDASSLFSADRYAKVIAPWDRRVLREFPFTLVHTHACGLHILDCLLDVPELRAVQVQLDRETGETDLDRVLWHCRRVQERGKGLLIQGQLTEQERAKVLSALSPDGLALDYWNPAAS